MSQNSQILENYEAICKRSAIHTLSSGRYILSAFGYPRLLARDICHKLELGSSDTVLDLGCNVGIYHRHLARRVRHLTGVDGGPAIVEKARRFNNLANVDYLLFDLTGPWPLGEKRFSKILVYSVIHFFDGEEVLDAFLKKVMQHLEPGGMILLGEVRTEEKYKAFQERQARKRIPGLRDAKFWFNKWFNRKYLGDVKGIPCTSFRSTAIERIANANGLHAREYDQARYHPFFNTCSDFVLRQK